MDRTAALRWDAERLRWNEKAERHTSMKTNLYHDDPSVAVPVVLVPSLPSRPEVPLFVTVPPLFETDPPDDDPAFPLLPRPGRLLLRDDEVEARDNRAAGASSKARRYTA